MIVEYREIKPSHIKPSFSATPERFESTPRLYVVEKKKPPNKGIQYADSYKIRGKL